MNDLEITPAEAKEHLQRGHGVLLIDVREPWEYDLCRIEGAKGCPVTTGDNDVLHFSGRLDHIVDPFVMLDWKETPSRSPDLQATLQV